MALTHWGRDNMTALSADDTFKRISLNENVIISIKISLKFVPKGPINNIPALVQIMAWRRSGDKPLSEPMMVSSLTHICVTRPQCVNGGRMYTNTFYQIAASFINNIFPEFAEQKVLPEILSYINSYQFYDMHTIYSSHIYPNHKVYSIRCAHCFDKVYFVSWRRHAIEQAFSSIGPWKGIHRSSGVSPHKSH